VLDVHIFRKGRAVGEGEGGRYIDIVGFLVD
jgi:hypothetical protein